MGSGKRPGPKSRLRTNVFVVAALLLLMSSSWPEGWTSAMGSLGTSFVEVKDHGSRPLNQHAGIPRKRAWKRALARADRQGCTLYKGTLLVASGEKSQPSKSYLKPEWQPQQTKPRRRLTFTTWNSGGLPYQFLMHWLQETSLDVAIIAETKCTWTSNWTTANYHMIHSGVLHGGLLIAVSRRLCASSDLSYEMVIPGRLVHVRLHNHSWPLDIIGVYQYDMVYWDFSSIQIPTFAAQGEEAVWRHYRLRGGIVHHGQNSTSGHYQGFIITPDEDYLLWDDDREPCQVQDHPMIFQQLVIVWATLIAPGDHFYSDVESLHTIASDDECLGLDPSEVTSHAASIEIQARKRTIARRHRRMTKQKTLRNKAKPDGQLGQLLETSFGNRLSG